MRGAGGRAIVPPFPPRRNHARRCPPPDDDHDPHAGAGAGIAEDRRARIVRRFAWPAAALATAGAIAWLGGCILSEEPETIASSEADTVHAVDWDGVGPFTMHPGDDFYVGHDRPDGGAVLSGRGYLASTEKYGPDFTVAYQYRFPDAAEMTEQDRPTCNTGCLLFITGEDKVWPRCLEVQGRWDDTAQIKSNARDVEVTSTLDEPARDAARKPPGEWNRVEIVSDGGALTVSLNGVEVATSEADGTETRADRVPGGGVPGRNFAT